jgi:hypothetical protein
MNTKEGPVVISTIRDVTERKRTESAILLKESAGCAG